MLLNIGFTAYLKKYYISELEVLELEVILTATVLIQINNSVSIGLVITSLPFHPSCFSPCVLHIASSCSSYTASGRRTLPCSPHWFGRQRLLPVGEELGWDMCTAPGGSR